ncbi:MAG: antirestriction protein ArdA [Sulfuricurvum sp.]|nr:antirestriction protein ArdA [Sulfuricurvum sp.]MDP3022992.1 antirestriction protein ArdA [Sulfuricurvum sp.]
MRVYITDLACYNNGILHGEWVELPCDNLGEVVQGILDEGTKICKDSIKHEEYFLTDYEDCLNQASEYSNVFELNHIAQRLEGMDEQQIKVIEFLLGDNIVNDIDEAIEHIDDVIIHEGTMEDIAEEYVENTVDMSSLPDLIRYHIDYEGIGRDLYIDGNYYKDEENGVIYEVCF